MDAVGFAVNVIRRQVRYVLLTLAARESGYLLQRDAFRLAARLLDLHRLDALLDLLYLLLQTLQFRLPAIAAVQVYGLTENAHVDAHVWFLFLRRMLLLSWNMVTVQADAAFSILHGQSHAAKHG